MTGMNHSVEFLYISFPPYQIKTFPCSVKEDCQFLGFREAELRQHIGVFMFKWAKEI